jgi:hypothetical protein
VLCGRSESKFSLEEVLMTSGLCGVFKKLGLSALLLVVASVIPIQLSHAQAPDARAQEIQQLKDKLQQLDQMMKDVKAEIDALQTQDQLKGAAPAPAPAVAVARSEEAKEPEAKGTFNIYGHVMLDAGYNFLQIDPNWYDVMRPTKLPAFKNEFGPDGSVFLSVRQTRFGVKTSNPTKYGDLKTWFEFEMFGTGVDAGQTTFRLRQAYGELGHFGAGQTWSPFMDIDVFPNSLEYWGPNGMVFFRNIQFRWMPIKGDSHLTIAAERPGASADGGSYADRIELAGVRANFNLPDLSVQGRLARKWGYIQEAAILRKIAWEDLNKTPTSDFSRSILGWGFSTSSNLNFSKRDVGRFEAVYGHGIQNYMNDAPVDVAIQTYPGTTTAPKGIALPLLGIVAFLDHNWTPKLSTAAGYSSLNIWNANGELPDAFHHGDYALSNLLYSPVPAFMFGGEFQYGRRENFSDGFSSNDYKLQFSFKYNYSKVFRY